ncbi:hypothetical protein AACH06_17200 [Ideonella sp. DXS29W]|uniref:Secreted protein n=1 Tax=Ideonella lacteola TaxID=2984193 RepID=A0ABU9BRH0_9BURK
MLRLISTFVVLAAALGSSQAAPTGAPLPGQYVRGDDSGTLTIRRDEQNKLVFEIDSIGGHCHECKVTGVIRGTIGYADRLIGDEDDSKCEISFSSNPSSVVVKPIAEDECREYCGFRAYFDGTYRRPSATCSRSGRQALRDRFLLLYRAHRYPLATSTLQTLIGECREFMGSIELDQVRNDLALSQYHNGDFSRCLETLDATSAGEERDEEELMSVLQPCDADNYIDVAKATWFNRALCKKAMSKLR